MTTPTQCEHAQTAAQVQRYKIGYPTDSWGERSSTPSGIPDHAGAWVRYEDHAAQVAALTAARPAAPQGVVYAELPDERAAFEAWIRKDCGDLSTFGSGQNIHYSNSAVNNAWTGWKARASNGQAPAGATEREFKQFLSDVLTAAGLVTHGKKCKALGERLGDMCMRLLALTAQAAPALAENGHLTQAGHDLLMEATLAGATLVSKGRLVGDMAQAVLDAGAVAGPWKDHQTREIVNQLRDCAKEFHATQQLRERLLDVLGPMIDWVRAVQAPTPAAQADSQPAPVLDMAVMQLAESVGLIGPASRVHDLHAAIQRFHDLICVNATIKAATMAAEVISSVSAHQSNTDYPPLPMQFACSGVFPVYSAEQMRAYVDADRAARAQADSPPAEAVQRIVHLRADREHRVYVAGPMTGLPEYNFPLFNATAAKLRSEGWHVENPAEHGHVEGAGWADYLRWDISRIATCGAIYLLPGWEKSKGARLEVHIAGVLGLRVLLADGAEVPPADSVLEDADPIRALIAQHAAILDQNESAYFELAYHRVTGWMAWITDKPLCMPPVVNPDRKVLAQGQGDTADEACADAARKQGAKHD